MSVYAVSDIHGYISIYNQIKEMLNPEDKVYCLGDCGDRGPHPWDTIKAVMKDPQFIYLKGNHDDMLVRAAREVFNFEYSPYSDRQRMLASNGGSDTLDELLGEESPEKWVREISNLPTHLTYTNADGKKIFLCHAGCTFWHDDPDTIPNNEELIWDRLHYYDSEKLMADKIVVHGHTPIKYLAMDINIPATEGALEYANGKKYCIDAGTFFSGRSILFNLDTFESIILKTND